MLRSAHDRFEALAGAVALGEATPAERAELQLHATGCTSCREDSALAANFATTVDAARSAEAWRPDIGESVFARIRSSRANRFRVTVAALGWVVALSIVLDVTFTTGAGLRLYDALQPAVREDVAAAQRVSARQSAPASVRLASQPVLRTATARAPRFVATTRVRRPFRPAAAVQGLAAPTHLPAASSDIPDVLAGLELDGRRTSARSVAALSTNSQP